MSNANDSAAAAINQKIIEIEREYQRIKQAAESLPVLEANLAALKRAQSILTGSPELELPRQSANGAGSQKTIGGLVLETLKEQGKPMHVDDLLPRIKAGGIEATRNTVISTLVRYYKAGKLKRPRPNTYAL